MLDIKWLRERLPWVEASLARRGYILEVEHWQVLEEERKRLQVEVENLQSQRNNQAKKIGAAKAQGQDLASLLAEGQGMADDLGVKNQALDHSLKAQQAWLDRIPNIPHDSVPEGHGEEKNQVVYEWGTRPVFTFPARDHEAIGAHYQGIDLEGARALSGARFMVLKGFIARLHRALTQLMLDVHTQEHGYTECYVPYLVDPHCLYGTGQLPKLAEDMFSVKDERGWYLIPTGEVPLTNLIRDQIIDPALLPLKLTTHTPCFRSEAGSYGKDTKGLFRQHQFDKVELVQIVDPAHSYEALEQLVGHAERILQRLELPYRKVLLCTGDMGFSAAKTYDLEVWLPGQNQYREISSCSNCEAFQARRMKARLRQEKKLEYVHTLNGSGLAVGRCLIAVLENHQQVDGSIRIPKALEPYL